MSEETIPQMREQINALEKQVKDLSKANSDFATENRVLSARDVFRTQGYSAEGGELFAAQNPEGEITAESVDAFVQKYGLASAGADDAAPETEEEAAPEAAAGSPDLATMSRSGSRAGEGGASGSSTEPMTRQEWQELMASDPAAGKAAVASGRVQISKDNPYSGGRAAPGNPFAAVAQSDS